MSILEEALRRAERTPSRASPRPAPAMSPAYSLTTSPQLSQASEQFRLGVYLAAGILVSILLAIWWLRFSPPLQRTRVTSPSYSTTQPFRVLPPTGMEPAPTTPAAVFRVSGLVTQPGAPLAVLNERIVHIGDIIEGAKVLEITATSVVLERDHHRLTLRLAH